MCLSWTFRAQSSFSHLKAAVTAAPLQVHISPAKPFTADGKVCSWTTGALCCVHSPKWIDSIVTLLHVRSSTRNKTRRANSHMATKDTKVWCTQVFGSHRVPQHYQRTSHTSPICCQQYLSPQKQAMGVTGSIWEHSSVLQPDYFRSITLGSNVLSLSKSNCPKIKAKRAEENPYPDKKIPDWDQTSIFPGSSLHPRHNI